MVRNHARKADARRRTRAGEGSHRRAVKQQESRPRVRTGLTALDALLGGGLRPGRLTVIAARTAMGKSMLALSLAADCAIRQDRPALVASLEMSNAELLYRLISAETGLLTEKVRRRELDDAEKERIHAFSSHSRPLFLGGDSSTPTVADIERSCEPALQRHGRLDLLVVDYLGLVEQDVRTPTAGREAEMARIVAGLHELAGRLEAAVVVVEQLTRAPLHRDDPRPRLTDMWHEQALLAHAETVIMLHRPAYYDPRHQTGRYDRSPDPDQYPAHLFPRYGLPEPAVQDAELHVPLSRHGRTGTVRVSVELARARFRDLPAGTA
ncbi:DnaB-like helicase C-terminal domain-containing protein [Streptomyces sp. NPDC001889]